MTEIHALSGAYAVDALDDLERAAFERHLAECAECQAEVASLREAAAMIAETTTTEPPPELRDRVLAGIRTVRPLPPEVSAATVRRRRTARFLVAAAAAALIAGGGVVVAQQPWDEASEVQLSVADQVLRAPDARESTLEFKDGSTATVTHSDSVGRSVIVTTDMAAPPEGKVFQLWYAQPDEGMVSAGLMPVEADQTVVLEGDAATATAVGITVEPEGGSPKPTSEPIALFDFARPSA
ncbi:anti-sigma factor [Nocardioides pyridinolyticus]